MQQQIRQGRLKVSKVLSLQGPKPVGFGRVSWFKRLPVRRESGCSSSPEFGASAEPVTAPELVPDLGQPQPESLSVRLGTPSNCGQRRERTKTDQAGKRHQTKWVRY
ncbi:regulatory protein, LysR:LysR, substrate-binding [Roseibium sp. TrichSKD4]|nr:regulatory protein, LysR:LysR, substrate-binding [Roseibium sp. TrichSKD4]